MGRNISADIDVLQAIHAVHPHCSFILDANEGYTSEEAVEVLGKLNGNGIFYLAINRCSLHGYYFSLYLFL